MENANNPTRGNYGKCFHSSIYTASSVEFIYTKAYKGDWGDWDEQPAGILTDLKQDEDDATECTPLQSL
ncbi:hypothetical protein [Flavobacterium sp. FlaQc-48]|uniref:hypothetical protein n=1 Tax=Flavobacterium sp. FlaQc-48 TaxID=3374181 RepID=UPI003757D70D